MQGVLRRAVAIYGAGALVCLCFAAMRLSEGSNAWIVWALLALWLTRVVDRLADRLADRVRK